MKLEVKLKYSEKLLKRIFIKTGGLFGKYANKEFKTNTLSEEQREWLWERGLVSPRHICPKVGYLPAFINDNGDIRWDFNSIFEVDSMNPDWSKYMDNYMVAVDNALEHCRMEKEQKNRKKKGEGK